MGHRILVTGGALLQASKAVRAPTFLVLNGDTYFAVPLQVLHDFHRAKRADVTMSLFRSDEPRYTGVALEPDGRIAGFSAKGTVNGGVFVFEAAALSALKMSKCSLEKDILAGLDGRIYGRVFDAPFIDIGLPEDWRAAAQVIR